MFRKFVGTTDVVDLTGLAWSSTRSIAEQKSRTNNQLRTWLPSP